ncbi:phage tail protein [Mycobacteroides abscessus subsp. abscessus]|uniref:phage tail tube protein n=1 Tax=Mycobacteroides abscessus TaxID=36809 RepID=UPI0009297D27|nr:phage tail protein [Mycobacteroides abscessus]QPO17396.1 major tail protein [Mycobacterium phage phiGD24-3]QSM02250.1 major tail protein [Mycobacterium phage prophiGD24-3]QSM04387.1 major tail protein [Mycobacterium phage prophiGD43A-4]WJJ55778.1 major tail protein [Mycobacterium phage prophiT46-3]MBN7403201.1 phage tail protein [Mycobacteroides abscessus subsp. abscessus]
MALDDDAVITAAVGYVYTATAGTAAPSPAEIDAFDPVTFGAQTQKVVASAATTLTVGGQNTPSLPTTATAAAVQTALEGLSTVGAGNVLVVGSTDPTDTIADGLNVSWVGEKLGETIALTGSTATITPVTAANGWSMTGHTSRDDLPEFGKDGGDTEVKGTWQNKALRETLSGDPRVDFVTVKLEQFDKRNLELFYGPDAASTAGVFGVDGSFTPVEKAVLMVIVDGTASIGFHAPKASIRGDDSIDMSVDGFTGFPVRFTFLKMGARRLFDWISGVFLD